MPFDKPSFARPRRGAVLLEVIVALVILVTAGLSAIALTRQASHSVESAQAASERMRAASAYLEVVSLWPREDLDRHLGNRRQGPWMMYIDRPSKILYRVVLYDSTGKTAQLETALFRPEPFNAAQ